jgi:iron complex outermembrane receptor protein
MMAKPCSRKKILSFAVSAALGVAGSSVWAQELEEELLDSETDAQLILNEDETVEEVVVTGSRIIRDGYSSASPMDVISADTAVVQGIADVGSLLQTTTIASG